MERLRLRFTGKGGDYLAVCLGCRLRFPATAWSGTQTASVRILGSHSPLHSFTLAIPCHPIAPMSHISLAVSDGNPVTQEAMLKAFSTISTNQLSLPEKDLKDYTTILAGSYEVFDKIMKLPDCERFFLLVAREVQSDETEATDVPIPDTMRFPRENVHRPQGEENKRNAWYVTRTAT